MRALFSFVAQCLLLLAGTTGYYSTSAAGAAPIAKAAVATSTTPTIKQYRHQVRDAYRAVEAEQQQRPPATNTSERLIRLGELDQAGREALSRLDFSIVAEPQRLEWRKLVGDEIASHDKIYQAELKRLIPDEGWFKISIYGKDASRSAFLIVQHAVNDMDFMRKILFKLGEFTRNGEAEGQAYAMMYDRISLEFDQKPQLYGTQVKCVDGQWRPYNLFEPDKVDERRKAIGMSQTIDQYLNMFANNKCQIN